MRHTIHCHTYSTLRAWAEAQGIFASRLRGIVQELYECRLISYPMTDSGGLPGCMADAGMLNERLTAVSKALGCGVLSVGRGFGPSALFDDAQVGAHHGIIPQQATLEGLAYLRQSELGLAVYAQIARRFIHALGAVVHVPAMPQLAVYALATPEAVKAIVANATFRVLLKA